MTPPDTQPDDPTAPVAADPSSAHTSRLQLIWDVMVFQLKLVADSLLDIVLSPLSIGAAILGLTSGGDDPHQYFRRLLRFGRRTEIWINLFALHRRRGTADEVMDGLRDRVFTEAAANPWLSRTGNRLNQKLDNVNTSRRAPPGDGTPGAGL